MEVYFVDVGLGSCHIILTGNRRAIVIDCGVASDHIALQFLKRFGITQIDCLITSHSDTDHTGGAISILNDYQDQIKRVYVVQDHKWLKTKYWRRIDYFIRQGILDVQQVKPLLREQRPKELWRDGANSQLKLYSPFFVENLRAQDGENSNATSSVIVLDHLGSRIVFAADSEIPQWKQIYKARGNRELTCDVLAVPHHGGRIGDRAGDLDWLYDKALSAKYAILSVGTRTNPKHPREEVVAKLITSGSTVLCTEITKKCHQRPHSLSPGVLQPLTVVGRAHDASQQGRDNAIACAGTVLAKIDSAGVAVDRITQHRAAVNSMAQTADGHPLCR